MMPKKFSELIPGKLRPIILTRLDTDYKTITIANVDQLMREIICPFAIPAAKEILAHPSQPLVIIVNLNQTGDAPENVYAAVKNVIAEGDAAYFLAHRSEIFTLKKLFAFVEIQNVKAIVDFRYAIGDDFTRDDLKKFMEGTGAARITEGKTDDDE